ncbi:helicase-related protein [Candidatus Solirubrobacter pratensis]|uniref:helicase-related protein n=1 Tax=Candidatus Solirubrobacter pratensis TaxID=1298857 RepID=UPI0012DC7095|nr:helicase-related protein [Candidatus Solirubrobacter pratensis]
MTDVLTAGSEPQYRVRFSSGAQVYSSRHLELAALDAGLEVDPVALLRDGALADAETFRAFMTLAKLDKPLADNLYSFAASRTERLPHQFKAVLKLLANPYGRLLIADEVGLGKTIEAGIILTELNARGALDHVLVACPSPLTQKWRSEMRDRFLFDFEVLDGQGFREFVTTDLDAPSPEPRRVIASLELMRRAENLEALGTAAPSLDVVIVDEAHHMRNVGTATNDLGEVLAGLAETVVFLTATPLNLGRQDFFNLMNLLVPEEFPQAETFSALIEPNEHINLALRHLRGTWPPRFDDALAALRRVERTALAARFTRSARYVGTRETLMRGAAGQAVGREQVVRCQRDLIELNTLSHVFTRTRKREVQDLFPTRRSRTVSVAFTDEESAFYDAVTDWALATYAERAAHLVAATFQRLAASCLPALGARLTDAVRSGLLTIGADEATELADDPGLGDALDDALAGEQVRLELQPSEAVNHLLATWDAYGGRVDSKFGGFERALTDSFAAGADRILVFSYFTGTIDYLAHRLANLFVDGRPLLVLKLYGPMNSEQRERAVTRFRDDRGPVVLLSSEVGSEGLDFQFCARMFNYDLPWNPMRVEQRIGRLDRYGQSSEVIHILNMIVAETIEERIFHRLYQRIQIFESSIGDLEAILGDVEVDLAALQRDALSGRLTDAELERRRNLIADVILRRQQDNETFEQESKQFLSNDEVFLELFNDIERSRRYVTPEELRLLVERYLAVCGCNVGLEPVGAQSGVFRLSGAIAPFRGLLARTLSHSGGGAKAARAFIGRLRDEGIDVTFEPAIATAQRRLEFISLHHPIVRALALSDDVRGALSCCAAIALDLDLAPSVPHGFFVFELQAHGLKDELEQAAVIVRPDGEVIDGGADLIARLEDARDVAVLRSLTGVEVDRMHHAALDWVTAEVAAREQELQARNDEIVTAQVESLRLTTDRRRLWLQQQIEEGRSAPIVRMRRSQLGRLEVDHETKLAALEGKRGISVGNRLVAAGLVVAV